MILSPNEIAWLLINVAGMTGEDVVIGTAVALAESGGDTDIMGSLSSDNPTTVKDETENVDLGLFQISNRWHGDKLQKYRWRDPYDNTRILRLVFDEWKRRPDSGGDGWKAWSVYNSGRHEAFMSRARNAVKFPFPPQPAQAGWRTIASNALLRLRSRI
jgi:hypothetical protein